MSITSYKTGTVSPSSLLVGNGYYVPLSEVEYLGVAGGGGGGSWGARGGGGGAGGLRSSMVGYSSGGGASAESKLSITPGVSYTVTIGAGGAGQDLL